MRVVCSRYGRVTPPSGDQMPAVHPRRLIMRPRRDRWSAGSSAALVHACGTAPGQPWSSLTPRDRTPTGRTSGASEPAVDLLGDLLVEVLGRLLGPAALGTLANAGGAELLGEHPQHVGLRLPENSRRMLGVIGVVVGPEVDALGIAQQHAEGVPGRIDHRGELTRRRGHGHTDLV